MGKVRVAGFGVSLDSFSAGVEQSLSDPLGKNGPEIFKWFFHTRTFQAMHGGEGGFKSTSTTSSRDGPWRALAPLFWAATCSVRCAGRGPMIRGGDGGATILPITRPRSC